MMLNFEESAYAGQVFITTETSMTSPSTSFLGGYSSSSPIGLGAIVQFCCFAHDAGHKQLLRIQHLLIVLTDACQYHQTTPYSQYVAFQ